VAAHRSPSVALREAERDEKSKTHEELPLLAFDTSGPHCAAALLFPDRVILRDEPMEKGQAERLVPLLEEVLAEGGIGWRDIKALAVGTGPGNFTGVRIAVAAARGLALGLGIPTVGVTSLEALAFERGNVLVAQDARRGMAYVQTFVPDGEAELVPVGTLPRSLAARAEPVVVGDLAERYASEHSWLAVAQPAYPLAEAIARKALLVVNSRRKRPAPFYLRGADAAPPTDPPPVILP
jgi:tRNA threonylcarbamoyladenosine biosynthesis protein TsaB